MSAPDRLRLRRLAAASMAALFALSLLPAGVAGPAPAAAQTALPFQGATDLPGSNLDTTAVALGDLDGDGDLDLVRVNGGTVRSVFSDVLLNDGGGRFSPRTELRQGGAPPSGGTSVAVGDLNGDGALDILIGFSGAPSRIFFNAGNAFGDGSGSAPNVLELPGSGRATNAVGIADLNGDGRLDLVLGNGGAASQIYLGDGAGGFSGPTDLAGSGRDTRALALADLSGDGFPDLVLGNYGAPSQVFVNDRQAGFSPTDLAGSGQGATGVALGHADADGRLDIVLVNYFAPVQVYINGGGAGFGTPTAIGDGARNTTGVAIGDINQDGRPDLAVSATDNPNGGPTRIHLGDPQARFGPGLDLPGVGRTMTGVALGDLDGDGDLDLVTGSRNGSGQVFLNSASGGATLAAPVNVPGSMREIVGVEAGDLNGDGWLDLVLVDEQQRSLISLNNGRGALTAAVELPGSAMGASSAAIGDLNGDGRLDIVLGRTSGPSQVYRNLGGGVFADPAPLGGGRLTRAIVMGDLDGDGDLDVVFANAGDGGQVFRNTGGGSFEPPADLAGPAQQATGVALGDLDDDGDLDVVMGYRGEAPLIFRNGGAGTFAWESIPGGSSRTTQDLALGDLNGDGRLDLVLANQGGASQIMFGDGHSFAPPADIVGSGSNVFEVALGDVEGDGDLDIALANLNELSQVFINAGVGRLGSPINMPARRLTYGVALADLSGDGSADLILGNIGGDLSDVFLLERGRPGLSGAPASVRVGRPGATPEAGGFSTAEILGGRYIQVPFSLAHPASQPAPQVHGSFSLDGGGTWRPARPRDPAQTINRATSPEGVRHTFEWDLYAPGEGFGAGVAGQSDNVVFRVEVRAASSSPAAPGSRSYPRAVAGPVQQGAYSAVSSPFRVRGTIARVVSAARPGGEPGATVYLQGAPPFDFLSRRLELPSDHRGYVNTRDVIYPGTTLFAVLPVTETERLTYAYTSAAPIDAGLALTPVTTDTLGVQTLVVSPQRPLLLLNLTISLEWSPAFGYRQELEQRLRRASALLYDWSDGQVALGRLVIFSEKGQWEHQLDEGGRVVRRGADIRVYASNRVRPSATQGGIVDEPTTVAYPAAPGGPRSVTYEPGHIRMGASWSAGGEPDVDSSEDWARALAHELGHYVFFLDETYLGKEGTLLVPTSGCPSPMADPYLESASELRPAGAWDEPCRRTLQHLGTGLSEWEQIQARYARTVARDGFAFSFNVPRSLGENPGPTRVPIDVTTFGYPTVREGVAFFTTATYSLLPPGGGRYEPSPGARAVLYRANGLELMDVGAPSGTGLTVRGIDAGDQLCLLDPAQELLGCDLGPRGLTLAAKPGWRPELRATPLTAPGSTASTTLTLRLEVPLASVGDAPRPAALQVRLYPSEGFGGPYVTPLLPAGDAYRGELRLPEFVEEGYLRLWVDEPAPRREALADYAIGGAPAPRRRPPRRQRRYAPAVSPDGQATLFAEDSSFSRGQFFTLQRVASPPPLPAWAIAVGQGYRLLASDPALLSQPANPIALSLSYAEGDVPPGFERDVRALFHDGAGWTELPTRVDLARNEAAVPAQATPGTYLLVTSLRLRFGQAGWGLIYSYPGATQPLPEALLGAPDGLRVVYGYDPTANSADPAADRWRLYTPHAPPWVSDLAELREGDSYWVRSSAAITLPLRLPGDPAPAAQGAAPGDELGVAAQGVLPPPPMALWGVIGPRAGVPAQPGLRVEAAIGGQVCGATLTRSLPGGGVGFALDVASRGDLDELGCGAPGATVTLRVLDSRGGELTSLALPWDTGDVRRVFLGGDAASIVFVPLLVRAGVD